MYERQDEIKTISVHHESVAGFMADVFIEFLVSLPPLLPPVVRDPQTYQLVLVTLILIPFLSLQ